jgi:ribulose-5-phosphate 4-epimerase/fuculose-1-phosphate aldolase
MTSTHTSTSIPAEQIALREAICRIGQSLFERGLVHSTAGNISVRLHQGYLITPTDACLGLLKADELAWIDEQGQQRGGLRASKTLALHQRIYAAAPNARCVLHTHSTHLVALTLQGVWSAEAILPPITPYQVMKVGRVPLLPYHRPGDPQVAELVAALMGQSPEPLRAVMLDRLGPMVWADSPGQAMAVLEELEETARLWLLCQPKPTALTQEQLHELQRNFGAHW